MLSGSANWIRELAKYEMAQVFRYLLDGFDEIMHIADLDF